MLVPDFSFNPSANLRNDLPVDLSAKKYRNFEGYKEIAIEQLTQFSIKEVMITQTKMPVTQSAVFLVTVVTDNMSAEPVKLRIESFKNVNCDQPLPLNSSGVVAYSNAADAKPTFLDYRILVIEAEADKLDVKTIYKKVISDPKYISVRDILVNVAKVAPPSSCLIAVASDIILNLAAKIIREVENNPLIYVRGSFDKKIDEMGTKYGIISQQNGQASVKYQVEAV